MRGKWFFFSSRNACIIFLGTPKEAIRANYFNMLLGKLDMLEDDDLIYE